MHAGQSKRADAPRDGAATTYAVTPLELFFDLVFVFAVSQLSRHLLAHPTWVGAAQTLVLLRATFSIWFTTSWSATIVPAGEARTLWMMLAVTLLGLFMNAALTRAFGAGHPWPFIVPFLIAQLGRTVWTLANSPNAGFRGHYRRTLAWFLCIAPLWIAGAAVAPAPRLALWAIAAVADTIGAWLAHPVPGFRLNSENVEFDVRHLLERCLQFQLIALGETVFTAGASIAAAPVRGITLVTGTSALAGVVALWGLGFGRTRSLIAAHAEETSDPVRAARGAVNALMVLVAGLISLAVANAMAIARPDRPVEAALALLLFGGPILFLGAQSWYLWALLRVRPLHQAYGIAALAALAVVALWLRGWEALALASGCTAVLVAIDWRQERSESVGAAAAA